MNFIEYYQNLPDVPTWQQSALAFELFFDSDLAKEYNIMSIEILQDLADRQWHTYEFPSDNIRQQVSEYLIQHININNEDEVMLSMQISCALGLKIVYDYITNQPTEENIKELIKEFQSEIMDIDDSYTELRWVLIILAVR